jgi:hypothetical protein
MVCTCYAFRHLRHDSPQISGSKFSNFQKDLKNCIGRPEIRNYTDLARISKAEGDNPFFGQFITSCFQGFMTDKQ